MQRLITAVGLISLFTCQAFAGEHWTLARVTVYWQGNGSGARAAWNGARLNAGDCAVNPKKIPYGSKVLFHDGECLAVDTGPDVINRKAARLCGRNATERSAIVIDRFFDRKEKALAWAKVHPHFMTVRILTPGIMQHTNPVTTTNPGSSLTDIANGATPLWRGQPNDFAQGLSVHGKMPTFASPNTFSQYARRRT
jgi:hypothetical protein